MRREGSPLFVSLPLSIFATLLGSGPLFLGGHVLQGSLIGEKILLWADFGRSLRRNLIRAPSIIILLRNILFLCSSPLLLRLLTMELWKDIARID